MDGFKKGENYGTWEKIISVNYKSHVVWSLWRNWRVFEY